MADDTAKPDDSPAPRQQRPWRTEGLPDGGGSSGDGTGGGTRPGWWRVALYGLLVYIVSFFAFSLVSSLTAEPTITVPYTEFTNQVQAHNVEGVYARGDTIEGRLRQEQPAPENSDAPPDTNYIQFVTERPTWAQDDLLTQLQAQGTAVRATPVVQQTSVWANLLFAFLPLLLLVSFYVWLFRRQRQMLGGGGAGGLGGLFGGGNTTKPVDPSSIRVTFDDVAGIDEVEAEVAEIVDYLKNPEKYRRLGARAPKGVLLAGAPGTGKTLLARATAGEAGAPFFSASASEFIEMVVGVGAQRVRQLFEEARKVAPAIVFIDEIDTIGRSRGGGRAMGGNDEREQTLNQILTEMDGFDGSEGVVVMAATNRADVLDPALTRPGRFDRTIMVNPPDAVGREQILRVHTRRIPLASDVDLTSIAKSTPGMTGADLANLANEAALLAARREADEVTQVNFFEALEKIQLGAARSVVVPQEERVRTAYHEAGHALLGMLQPGADPVRKISIIPRGRALGVTVSTPETDKYGYDERYLRGRIIGALGGMAAEEVLYGVVTTGAESDLETSTGIARQMVGRWGMSEAIGPVQIYPQDSDPRSAGFSEDLLGRADAEVRRIVDECFEEAKRLLAENRHRLDGIVGELLQHESLNEADAYRAAGVDRATGELLEPVVAEISNTPIPADRP